MNTMRELARGYRSNPEQCLAAARATFTGIPAAEVREIFSSVTGTQAIERLAERSCQPRLSLEGVEVKTMDKRKHHPRELTDRINEELNKREPVEATYVTGCVEAADCEGRSGYHSSLVVGRRFNPATRLCEYLIRNSWGRSCLSQGRGMDCEEGHVWVPKTQLHQGLYGITYLQ